MSDTPRKYVAGIFPSGRSTSRDMLNIDMLGGTVADDLLVSAVMVVDRSAHPRRTQLALQSLTPQTFDGWECVVVCNGPVTEDLQETLNECTSLDERIRVLPLNDPVSPAAARNRGIECTRGPFIANLSPNAISEPDRFLNQLLAFQDHPEVVACGTWIRLIDEEQHILGVRRYPAEADKIARRLCLENPTCEASLMFRRAFAQYPEQQPYGSCFGHLVQLVLSDRPVINVPQFLAASSEPERPECQAGWAGMRAYMSARRRAILLLPVWKRPLAVLFIWLLSLACCMPLNLWRTARYLRDSLMG